MAGLTERTCIIDGCTAKHLARGWCGKHYQRWSKTGDPLSEPPGAQRRERYLASHERTGSVGPLCTVPECTKPVRVKLYGWCGMHHARWLKTGSTQAHWPCRDDRRSDGWLWCSRCESHKSPDDFYRNRAAKTGHDGVCRDCTDKHRRDKREHMTALRRAYVAKNRERVLAQKRASYRRNSQRSSAAGRAWRKANPDRTRLQIRAQNAARYARDKGAPGCCSTQQLADRWAYYGGKCWMCGAPATDSDHVKPLGAGGSNWPANLRPACRKCNRAKGAKWPWSPEVVRGHRPPGRQAA